MKLNSPKARSVIAIVITIVFTAIFIMAGSMKLLGLGGMPADFMRWGYPDWFRYVVGTFEVLGALALWSKKARVLVSQGFVGLMIGAMVTNLRSDSISVAIFPGVLLLLAIELAWIRQQQKIEIDKEEAEWKKEDELEAKAEAEAKASEGDKEDVADEAPDEEENADEKSE